MYGRHGGKWGSQWRDYEMLQHKSSFKHIKDGLFFSGLEKKIFVVTPLVAQVSPSNNQGPPGWYVRIYIRKNSCLLLVFLHVNWRSRDHLSSFFSPGIDVSNICLTCTIENTHFLFCRIGLCGIENLFQSQQANIETRFKNETIRQINGTTLK